MYIHVHVYITCMYIGRESGSDKGREEREGGRNGVGQGKNGERKDNAKTGIVVQCEKYTNYVYTCVHVCTCSLYMCVP